MTGSQRAVRSAFGAVAVGVATIALVGGAAGATDARAIEQGPVGWDSFTRLDKLPYLRSGVRTYQVSSVDPTGGNDDGFTGKYSCLRKVARGCLLAEHKGAGELNTVWSPGPFFGDVSGVGRLRVELDGRPVVDESMQSIVDGRLGSPFVRPLVATFRQTSGGHSIGVPMTFRRSMRVIAERNPGYWQVVYRTFADRSRLRTFRGAAGSAAAIGRLRRSGRADPKPSMGSPATTNRSFSIRSGQTKVLTRLRGSGAITALAVRLRRLAPSVGRSADTAQLEAMQRLRLRIAFDGRRTVDAPLGEFFGSGLAPARVQALMFAMDSEPGAWARSWWPMPYRGSAEISVANRSKVSVRLADLRVRTESADRWEAALGRNGTAGYFHARGRRGLTVPGRNWTFLDVRGRGTFVGVSHTMEGPTPPYYLEGDEQGYVDGARRPQLQGTGTEDFYRGGWYWYENLFTAPLFGYSQARGPANGCTRGTCKAAYRLLIADAVAFDRSIRYEIEHGPENTVPAAYSSTAFWYQQR